MKNRDEIITGMCLTWDHAFLAPRQEIFPGHVFGLTDEEKLRLYNKMEQVFDNDIQPLLDDHEYEVSASTVPIPKSKEHAEAMIAIATLYLEGQKK